MKGKATMLLLCALLVIVLPVSTDAAGQPRTIVTPRGAIVLQIVGQVAIASPCTPVATSIQYGYLPYLYAVSPLFEPGPRDETTALYTFYTRAATVSTSIDGPLKIVVRRGTTTLYRNFQAHDTFADPDSFRRGAPIQTSTLRQQVIVDTLTRAFTTVNLNAVTGVRTFILAGRATRFGRVGDRFRTSLTGHLVPGGEGPPCGYFAGYAVEVSGRARHRDFQDSSAVLFEFIRPLIKYPC